MNMNRRLFLQSIGILLSATPILGVPLKETNYKNPNIAFDKGDWDLKEIEKHLSIKKSLKYQYRIFPMEIKDNPMWGLRFDMDKFDFDKEEMICDKLELPKNIEGQGDDYDNDELCGFCLEHHNINFFHIWIREDEGKNVQKAHQIIQNLIDIIENQMKPAKY